MAASSTRAATCSRRRSSLVVGVWSVIVACCSSNDDRASRLASVGTLSSALVQSAVTADTRAAVELAAADARRVVESDADPQTFVAALWRMLIDARVGHTGIFEPIDALPCRALPWVRVPGLSGVTAVPGERGFIVASAANGNPLGLAVGDLVAAIDGADGVDAMTQRILRVPFCVSLSPSSSGRSAKAARYFSDALAAGARLRVVNSAGDAREVMMPNLPLPAEGPRRVGAGAAPTVTMRGDMAILRVPSFSIAERDLASALAMTRTARALVIDVRDNGGGSKQIAQDLAGALPGARHVNVIRCEPGFGTELSGPTSSGDLDPAERLQPITVPTAVLVNGGTYSAGSTFVRYAATASSAILVGVPDAAAFGNSNTRIELPGPPALTVTLNTERCFAIDGAALEGQPSEVNVHILMDPADVARGVDTQLERAIAAL